MFKKTFFAAAAVVAVAASFSHAAVSREVLRVGTEPTFAPFEFLDTKTKDFTGFDIDLIRAVADKAGYDIQILNMGFDALIPGLMTGSIDVIASGLSITPERTKKVDFTTPYYRTGLSILVRAENADKFKTVDDLANQSIAVQIGTTGHEKAKTIPGAKVSAFNTTSEAYMDLNSGSAAAVIIDRPVIAYFLKTKPRVAKTLKIQPEILDAESFGFAVRKGNTALLEKLDKAYAELMANGEAQKINAKWFAQ